MLTSFPRKTSPAASQQFYDPILTEAESKDHSVKDFGQELSTMTANKLEYIINHINKLIAMKFESIADVGDATELNHIKGYVAGLKDLKRLFEAALENRRK